MLKTYDTTSEAFVEHMAKIYDETAGAWIDAPSMKTYDGTEQAWIDRLKTYMEATVGSGFYHNSGNVVFSDNECVHCEVKPTSSTYLIELSLMKDFTDPVISCEYSFGYSDECPAIATGFLSHACIEWYVEGRLNGSTVATANIAYGSSYAYETIFDESKTVSLSGTFDEIRLVCQVASYSSYSNYGRANTTIDNFAVNGKIYGTKVTTFES